MSGWRRTSDEIIEQTWRRLIVEENDSPEAEELRQLFFGTALSPEEESC